MLKVIPIILFPMVSIGQVNSPSTGAKFIFKGPIYNNQNTALVSNENREWKDSLEFIVVRGKYISGVLHVEILENKLQKTYVWKQFYPNGHLMEIGSMTKDKLICFGKWIYYSENGKINNIIDYDDLLIITYSKALEIASSFGYKMPNIDIDLISTEDKLYWQIRKWIVKNGDGISSTILISTSDGSIKKPKQEVEIQY